MRFLFTGRKNQSRRINPVAVRRLQYLSRTKIIPEMPPSAVMSPGIEYMEDGLPDPVKAMGRILVENLCIDPKLALDAAWRLAQFTHHKKGIPGKIGKR